MHIIPAVLPETFEDIENHAIRVKEKASWMQVDVCDGMFVDSKTWPYVQGGWQTIPRDLELPFWQDLQYECDIMAQKPFSVLESVMEFGFSRAIIHLDSTDDEEIYKCLRALEHYDMEAVLAISHQTPFERLQKIIAEGGHPVHGVQCMGIERLGHQGMRMGEKTYDMVALCAQAFPELVVSVDGGVNLDTAPQLISAGATRLVCGSAIFQSGDSLGTIEALEQMFIAHDSQSY